MKLMKMLGLTAFAAMVAMAFVGASAASAADNVVLCSVLPEPSSKLCNEAGGKLLPKGTIILAVNEGANPILKGTINEECESSHVEGKTTFETGPTLLGELTSISFTKNCKPCTTVTMEGLPYTTHLEAEAGDKFVLNTLEVKAKLSGCTFGVSCVFGESSVKVDVRDNAGQLLIESLEAPLKLLSGSTILCGSTGKWIATYKAECKEPNGTVIKCYPALDPAEAAK